MAVCALSSAATPPKVVGNAPVAFTLWIREHGKVLRTVRFHVTQPFTADDVRVWLKTAGYWEVDLLGNGRSSTLTLCFPSVCADAEPGHGAPFDNVEATTRGLGPKQGEIVLKGSMTIRGRASIAVVSADRWISPNKSRGGLLVDTPELIAVAPGQTVLFTIKLSIPFGRG
jgi:hypothetical protein